VSASQPSVVDREREDGRVRAFGVVAAAIAGEHELTAVLEIAAEQTRRVLGVSSVSISRWHLDEGRLRTLINVGDLGPGEQRWPADELYPLSDFPAAVALLTRGQPHVTVVDDPGADESERALLVSLGKTSSAAVPVIHGGVTWGELYVANGAHVPALRPVDVEFLQAICFQLALAIGRAQLFSQLSEAAYHDALTGLANRRAFDERLDELDAQGALNGLVLALGDLDGLKLRNDRDGHQAGDRALRLVGRVLREVCGPDVLAARLGGDEFCIVLSGGTHQTAEVLVTEAAARLQGADPTVTISWGIGAGSAETRASREVLQLADQRQYAAKRARPRSRADARRAPAPPRRSHRTGPRASASAPAAHDRLAAEGLELLDAIGGQDPQRRGEAVAALIADRVGEGGAASAPAAVIELLLREAARPGA
jgi:diguanylate cyclase (GGDEF)-like protein